MLISLVQEESESILLPLNLQYSVIFDQYVRNPQFSYVFEIDPGVSIMLDFQPI